MVEALLLGGLSIAVAAGLMGLLYIGRTWRSVRSGPGGDLTNEVVYLRGAHLTRPFVVLMSALVLEVAKQIYWILWLVEAIPATPNLFFHASIVQGILLLVGGVMFYRTLRGFTPAARVHKRREMLRILASAMQSRTRSARHKDD